MGIRKGDTVQVHYTGMYTDGKVFDSSRDGQPLTFVVGEESLITGFERAVIGHERGDRFTVRISPEDGYGLYNNDMMLDMPLSDFPRDITPQVGMMLDIEVDQGKLTVQISDIKNGTIFMDANHPLAGEELVFDIEILSVHSKL